MNKYIDKQINHLINLKVGPCLNDFWLYRIPSH